MSDTEAAKDAARADAVRDVVRWLAKLDAERANWRAGSILLGSAIYREFGVRP